MAPKPKRRRRLRAAQTWHRASTRAAIAHYRRSMDRSQTRADFGAAQRT